MDDEDSMSLLVACIDCRASFDALLNAGLVRCEACTEQHAPVMPRAMGRTVVLDAITVLD